MATIAARASAGAETTKGQTEFIFERVWIGGCPSETVRGVGSIGDETFPSYAISGEFLDSTTSEICFERIPLGIGREMVSGFAWTSRIASRDSRSETETSTHSIVLIECSVDIVRLSGKVIGFGHGRDGFPSWRCGTGHSTSGIVVTTRLTVGDGGRSDGGVAPSPDLRSDGDIGFGTIRVDYTPVVSTSLTQSRTSSGTGGGRGGENGSRLSVVRLAGSVRGVSPRSTGWCGYR